MASSSFSSPWPDPNSPVLSKIDFGVPLVELFKWLDVRDTLLGDNFKKQDITAALALARDCKHPDAVWLTSIFEGKDVSTKEKVREVFLWHQDDARALCFAWWMNEMRGNDLTLLRRAAEMGNAFACSTLGGKVWPESEEEAFRLAQFSVAHRECDGFFLLGFCFGYGVCCERDLHLAKENFLIASELGHIWAAVEFGCLLEHSDPVCWLWLSRAASCGLRNSFLDSLSKPIEQFFSDSENATVVFVIGRALKGKIDMEKKKIFGSNYKFDSLISPVNQAVSFYESQISAVRVAVDTWTLVATRLHVIKDMRVLIGKMIWEARFEANYKI